ncbi:MAG: superoxide dismutase [Pseudomonadota bacterium]|nr:superoxide dismutase [Syntrophaceae bacterium]MBP7033357.1 superoxide dismutase [Syntrophobacterales bacterium]MDI9554898.1 superoxide dismutase [Pseudomonadota bacterium]NLX30548.1 superoxide dismutase [Deltaproteobacteria bacterium]HNU85874.1 superoxide dismutase [Syntrophales bacterium]
MDKPHFYSLPKLPYGYKELAPFMSEEQLRIHHEKHHQAYVTGANALFEKLEQARKAGGELDMKAALKELSFHIGGHLLHGLFWENLAPAGKGGGGKPAGVLGAAIDKEFGGFERFQKEFTQAAVSAEGSGWAALSWCRMSNRPLVMQIEKHNVDVCPALPVILAIDVWEHAYYLDYRNMRAKFVEAFWNIVNWAEANRRFTALLKSAAA